MVGVSVATVVAEGDHHVRADAAQVGHELGDDLGRRRLVEVAVQVVQEIDPSDAKHVGGGIQLRLAAHAQNVQARVPAGAEPAALTARRRDQRDLHTFGRIARQRAAHTHRFVVRVCKDSHQPQHRGRAPFPSHLHSGTTGRPRHRGNYL
jgi:hypothetical protein